MWRNKKNEKSIFSRNQLGDGEGRKLTAAGCHSELVGGEHRGQVFSNKPSCLMSWAVFVPSHVTSIPASVIYLNLKSQQDSKRVKQKHSIGFTASLTEVRPHRGQRLRSATTPQCVFERSRNSPHGLKNWRMGTLIDSSGLTRFSGWMASSPLMRPICC